MENSKSIETFRSLSCKLDKVESGKSINLKFYWDIIRSLLYLMVSRFDIIFSNICMYARYQSNPKESYLFTVKRILRYLIGTLILTLIYDILDILLLN